MEKGLKELKREVLETEACTACGTCVSLCPNIVSIEDRIAAIGTCELDSGRCYRYCPRTELAPHLRDQLFGDAGYSGTVGPYLEYFVGWSTLPGGGNAFQYGGVVSALLIQALEDGLIDSAVVTKAADNFPQSMTAHNHREILNAGRSKFALSPTNKEANKTSTNPTRRLGAVVLPCQSTGLRKKQLQPRDDGVDEGRIILNLGLFCTWAISQRGWRSLVRRYVGNGTVQRIDIPPPPANVMEISVDHEKKVLSLDEVRSFIRPACQVCLDMTAENADLSVGMVEGREGFNTILVRTELGKSLLKKAVQSGFIKLEPLDDERWKHLNEASANKKKRALAEAQKRGESLPYYARIIKLKNKIRKQR